MTSERNRNKESVKISFRNFGLIEEASIELGSLDIFIGRNITGKSYAAVLTYAVLNALGTGRPLPFRGSPLRLRRKTSPRLSDSDRDGFSRLVQSLLTDYASGKSSLASKNEFLQVPVSQLSEGEKNVIATTMRSLIQTKGIGLASEISRCFNAPMQTLVRSTCRPSDLSIRVIQDFPKLDVEFIFDGSTFQTTIRELEIQGLTFQIPQLPFPHPGRPSAQDRRAMAGYATDIAIDILSTAIFKFTQRGVVYLPAARSGILQAQRAIASTMVGVAPYVGLQDVEIPAFAGTVSDFLSALFLMREHSGREVPSSAALLESEILSGHVLLQTRGQGLPSIEFETGGNLYPIHLASSMVSELAPLVLFLRDHVRQGDIVIIEEPEAHLHPGAQVSLARAIARMVRENIDLVITTHSEFLITELNNYIRRGSMSPVQRTDAGYPQDDFLLPTEVRGYLFEASAQEKSVKVRPLKVTPEEGIPSDQIDKVSLALHEEFTKTYDIVSGGDQSA